ncbi:hypothetical protein WME90_43755 [Sorangium sp. So ce375]|uniref:hypothetical protein n=1 Tax=Sorangium sp. So ce375 TaxID=3133306 RepID=UPI003F5BAF4C
MRRTAWMGSLQSQTVLLCAAGVIALGCAPDLHVGVLDGTGGGSSSSGTGGSGTGGGGSGAGGGGGSAPDETCTAPTRPCYSDLAATKGVGRCHAGVQRCDEATQSWGTCEGEITPVAETCNNEDDDCDGQLDEDTPGSGEPCSTGLLGACADGVTACVNAGKVCSPKRTPAVEVCDTPEDESCDGLTLCQGAVLWSKRFGSSAGERAVAAVDPDDNIVLVGGFGATLGLGGTELVSVGLADMFVAKLDRDGKHLWSKRFGSATGGEEATAVGIDGAGNLVIAGTGTGSVDFGQGEISLEGGFLLKLDRDGRLLWSQPFGASARFAVDAAGNIYTGDSGDDPALCGDMTSNGVLFSKLDPSGHALWKSCVPGSASVAQVVADSDGSLVAIGAVLEGLDFGNGPIGNSKADSVFVAKLDPAGDIAWGRRVINSNGFDPAWVGPVAVDRDHNIIAGGESETSSGSDSYSRARLHALTPGGSPLWDRYFTRSPASGSVDHVVTDGANQVVVSGGFYGTVDLGGATLTTGGAYVGKLSPAGDHIWSRTLSAVPHLAVDRTGNVVLSGAFGAFGEPFDLGNGPTASLGGTDIFLVKLAP